MAPNPYTDALQREIYEMQSRCAEMSHRLTHFGPRHTEEEKKGFAQLRDELLSLHDIVCRKQRELPQRWTITNINNEVHMQCPRCRFTWHPGHNAWCSFVCLQCRATLENPTHTEYHIGDECYHEE